MLARRSPLKITSLKLHPVAADRRYATVIAQEGGRAKREVSRSYFYMLELAAGDELTGWGEVSDIPPEEAPDDREQYAELLAAFTVGRDAFDLQQMHREFVEHFDVENSEVARYARCALDMAMYDLQAQATGRPIYDLLGGPVRREVEISWVAFIRDDLKALREEIREKCQQGFRALKLKVGVDIALDEARLAAARETAGDDVKIKIDANEGWSVDEAIENIRRLERFGLAGVETPVPRQRPADIAAVRKAVDVPILEHVNTLEYGLELVRAEAIDVMNVATTGAGGIWPARQIIALSQAAGCGVLLGSTVELGPGTLAQLQLAATVPNLSLPSDLVGPGMYRQDVLASPLRYQDGKLAIPATAGLGGKIDRAKIRARAFTSAE